MNIYILNVSMYVESYKYYLDDIEKLFVILYAAGTRNECYCNKVDNIYT